MYDGLRYVGDNVEVNTWWWQAMIIGMNYDSWVKRYIFRSMFYQDCITREGWIRMLLFVWCVRMNKRIDIRFYLGHQNEYRILING
jgi:hypothetical protein